MSAAPTLQNLDHDLVLASKSQIRADVLSQAGFSFEVVPSGVDEDELKAEISDLHALARALAVAKAKTVSATRPEAFIIGADQIMQCAGRVFDKPSSMQEARDNLAFLSGKPHQLLSGIALVRGGEVLWSDTIVATLHVRTLSEQDLSLYLAAAGESILSSVGCYRLEGVGIHLFEKIEGDHLTIYGLPLLPLLPHLRQWGVLR
ncbi:MAG: Maf family protein [Parvibaculales bacterium]